MKVYPIQTDTDRAQLRQNQSDRRFLASPEASGSVRDLGHLWAKHEVQGGFSLVEMIIVIAIIALIATFITPAAASLLKGSQLGQAGLMVNDQLALARQTALSKNRLIEVRFYRCGDPEIPGENVTNAANGKYRGMQLFQIEEDGSANPIAEAIRLPVAMIMDSSSVFSTILNQTARPVGKSPTAPAIPRVGDIYDYSFFRFRPNGSTDLLDPANPTAPWFVTIHALTDGDARNVAPPNFYTIQIDAFNGNIRTFRP
jgi:uncharacterized protein (TIGR02596 family)